MAFVRAAPDMPERVLAAARISLARLGAFYSMRTANGALFEGSLSHIVHRLHRFLFETILHEAAGAPILHAATVVVEGARIILVAQKAVGKSTLTARLLAEGFVIEGDEHVVVFGRSVIARPRTMRIKQGTIGLIPALREIILASPTIRDWDGRLIYSVQPALPGRRWRIEQGNVKAIVTLEQNHGGHSIMTRLDQNEALRLAISMSFLPETGKAMAAARLRALIQGASCYRLALGDLDNAVWHLKQAAYN